MRHSVRGGGGGGDGRRSSGPRRAAPDPPSNARAAGLVVGACFLDTTPEKAGSSASIVDGERPPRVPDETGRSGPRGPNRPPCCHRPAPFGRKGMTARRWSKPVQWIEPPGLVQKSGATTRKRVGSWLSGSGSSGRRRTPGRRGPDAPKNAGRTNVTRPGKLRRVEGTTRVPPAPHRRRIRLGLYPSTCRHAFVQAPLGRPEARRGIDDPGRGRVVGWSVPVVRKCDRDCGCPRKCHRHLRAR